MYKYHLCILIGTYNRLSLLKRFIASVRNDMPRGVTYYFCVADGGSTDGTIDYLRQQTDVRLIEQGKLIGGIKAYTEAGKTITDARLTLIANDDIEILQGSIPAAIVHLDSTPTCGGVAFYTDQPLQHKPSGSFNVQTHRGVNSKGEVALVYAQVGLFHTQLCHEAGWWGGDDATFGAYHYGADNYLSSRIQETGVTIDPVLACKYHDVLPPDPLRDTNIKRAQDDAERYHNRFKGGVRVPDSPAILPPDKYARDMRVLYLPIYEPHVVRQYHTKHSLRDALSARFMVWEYPYTLVAHNERDPQLRRATVTQQLVNIIGMWKPDLVLAQIHDATTINANSLAAMRAAHPSAYWTIWNGDVWDKGLIHPDMLELLRYVDLQTTVNASVLPIYAERNIPAAYWQIGYEYPIGEINTALVHRFDIVFMGNNYSKERTALYEGLSTLDDGKTSVGFYGSGWPVSQGDTLYDFATSEAVLQLATLAIGDNQFPDAKGFVSNRFIQTLGAGGAILLQQHVPGLDELLGLDAGIHYVEWTNFSDLLSKVGYWLSPSRAKRRKEMATEARKAILKSHTFDARLDELFQNIKTAHRSGGRNVRMIYNFPNGNPRDFGFRTHMRNNLRFVPNTPVAVTQEEAQWLKRDDPNWQVVE